MVKKKWHVFALILLIVLISYPVMFMDVAKGHDLEFHLMRIDGILSDVSFHNLPVRVQSKWLDGYGYPVSILYGDLFLYAAAVLRKLGLAIMPAYRIFVVGINTATVLISYFSFNTIFKNKAVSVLTTVLYSTAAYRLVDEYVRSAVGETLTIVFLPAVAVSVYLIITGQDTMQRMRGAVILAFAFTSVTCAHTLTTSMMVVVLIPVCIAALFVFIKAGERLARFWGFVAAAVMTVFLSGFFIFPFLDYYLFSDIAFASDEDMSIQQFGVSFSDLFSFFVNPFGGEGSGIQKSPGIALMAALICAVVYVVISLVRKKYFEDHRRIVFETVGALFMIFMASRAFPWDFIEHNLPLGNILTAIEFPMRYLAFAILFIAMLAGDLLKGLAGTKYVKENTSRGRIIPAVCTVLCIMCVFNVVNLCVYNTRYEKKAHFMTEEDLGRWEYYAMDFQLKDTTVNDLPLGLVYEGLQNMEVLSRNSNDFLIACTSGPEYGWIQLPVFNYKYYYAHDVEDPSKVFEIHDGANRTVGVLLPGDYSGVVHIYWREPVWWRIVKYISLISFGAALVFLFAPNTFSRLGKKREAAQ